MISRHYYNPSAQQVAAVQQLRAELQARRLRRKVSFDWRAQWDTERDRFECAAMPPAEGNVLRTSR